MVVAGWRWQWWHHLPKRWGSATLPPTCSRLPQHLSERWVGSTTAEDRALLRWPPRLPDLTPCDILRALLSTTCITGSAWAPKTNHRCHFRNRSWHVKAGMGANGFSAWLLSCHKRQTHRELVRYAKNTKLGEFLFPSVGRMLWSFSPFKCIYFMDCQGIMNNPLCIDFIDCQGIINNLLLNYFWNWCSFVDWGKSLKM